MKWILSLWMVLMVLPASALAGDHASCARRLAGESGARSAGNGGGAMGRTRLGLERLEERETPAVAWDYVADAYASDPETAIVHWHAAYSDATPPGSIRYDVYADGNYVATTGGTSVSVDISGYFPGQTVSFYVYASDSADGDTAFTGPVQLVVPARPPEAPYSVSTYADDPETLSVYFSHDGIYTDRYEVRLDGVTYDTLGVGERSTTLYGLQPGETYQVSVVAVNEAYQVSSGSVSVTMPEYLPGPVEDLVGYTLSPTEVRLDWLTPSDSTVRRYRVFQLVGSNWSLLTTTTSTQIDVNGLEPDTEYTFGVTAENTAGESEIRSVTLTTPNAPPLAPRDVRATATSPTEVALNWAPGSRNTTGYEIYRQVLGGALERIAIVDASTTQYVVRDNPDYRTITFSVVATNGLGSSPAASARVFTPLAQFVRLEGKQNVIVAAGGEGDEPFVKAFEVVDGRFEPVASFYAYEPTFRGGVYVHLADYDADGTLDFVLGTGNGGGPRVRVVSGKGGGVLRDFFAYEDSFRGGVLVSTGDVDKDGKLDIITGTGVGGGPRVQVFSGATNALIHNFFAYEDSFRGGVFVKGADVNGDGHADIVTGVGVGGGPRVQAFDGRTAQPLYNFFPFEPSARGGVFVSAGDFDGDNRADLIAAAGVGGGPRVRIISGADGQTQLADGFVGDTGNRSGVNPAFFRAADGSAYLVTAEGKGRPPVVRLSRVNPATGAFDPIAEFQVVDLTFLGGIRVDATDR